MLLVMHGSLNGILIQENQMKKIFLVILIVVFAFIPVFSGQNPVVVMKTSLGDIEIELYHDKAPVTVNNFLAYVDSGFYDGTVFHRVINNFMIQGGGMIPGLQEKRTLSPIKNEAGNGLSNLRGTIAMARTQDVNSATSQFFINVADNRYLDYKNASPAGYGYCVFGRVIKGMDVVDRIKSVATGRRGYYDDVPVRDVVIISIKRKN
mgnify:CR=1 FL=1